jgi:hypothetical protein
MYRLDRRGLRHEKGNTLMIALPLDPTLTLVALSEPRPQIKNQQTGEIALDRDTNEKMYQMDVALTVAGGRPMTFQLQFPESGLNADVAVYSPMHAVGLTFISGEKNGRTWQMYRAAGVTPLVTAIARPKAA